MTPQRFKAITRRYRDLRVVLIGDFSLDRYLEIDPTRAEKSIETGLPVYNVVRVRAQPGSAGTILNNLCALGVGTIIPIGFCGKDGEGYELQEALSAKPGVVLDHFLQTTDRCTFTYCKPLVIESGKPPRELNRLDQKNWSPTPKRVQKQLTDGLLDAAAGADAVIVMDQVDIAGTGVVTDSVLKTLKGLAHRRRELPIIADSRRGLRGYPPVIFKMNGAELAALTGSRRAPNPNQARQRAAELSRKNQRHVFVTLADKGIVGASPDGQTEHQPTWPVEGPIDIVGAGDSVTANLAAALAAGAGLEEAMAFANAAASIVIHQLGTTGTASVKQLSKRLGIGSR